MSRIRRAGSRRDGYLYLPGLIDREPVLELRRAVLGVCSIATACA